MITNDQVDAHSGLRNNFFLCAPVHDPAWFYTTIDFANELAAVPDGTEATIGGSGVAQLRRQDVCAYTGVCIRLTRGATAGSSPEVSGRIVGTSPFGNKITSSFRIVSASHQYTFTRADASTQSIGGGAIVVTDKAFARVDRIIFDSVSANNGDRLEIGYVYKGMAPYIVETNMVRGSGTGMDIATDGADATIPHYPGKWEKEGIPAIRLDCDSTDANAQQFADGDVVIVADETETFRFEWDNNSTVRAGNVLVAIPGTANAQNNRDALIAAINAQSSKFRAEIDHTVSANRGALLIYGGGESFTVQTCDATGRVANTRVQDPLTNAELDYLIAFNAPGQLIPSPSPQGAVIGDLIEIDDARGNVVKFEIGASPDSGNTGVAIGGTAPLSTATNLTSAINGSALDLLAEDVGGIQGLVRILLGPGTGTATGVATFRVSLFTNNSHVQYTRPHAARARYLAGPLQGQVYSLEMSHVGSALGGAGNKSANPQPFQATPWGEWRVRAKPFGIAIEDGLEQLKAGGFKFQIRDNTAVDAGSEDAAYGPGQTLAYFGLCRVRREATVQFVNPRRLLSPGVRDVVGQSALGSLFSIGERGFLNMRHTLWEAPSQDEGFLVQ